MSPVSRLSVIGAVAVVLLAVLAMVDEVRTRRAEARPEQLRERALAAANARDGQRRRHSRHVRRWRWR